MEASASEATASERVASPQLSLPQFSNSAPSGSVGLASRIVEDKGFVALQETLEAYALLDLQQDIMVADRTTKIGDASDISSLPR
jgi:hypothetical protein